MTIPTTGNSDRRVLDEAGGLRAMTWVLAIMLFLTVLAAALGLGTRGAAHLLDRQLAGRLTIQIVDGDQITRDAAVARVMTLLRGTPQVTRAQPVDRAELARLLRPWLGSDSADPDLPVPAMIDVDLTDADAAPRIAAAVKAVSPAARIDRHERWMSPVSDFMTALTWLAAGLVLLMLVATSAVVMLTARAGLETHRATIEVMHMLGSTDVQVARLFQRRIAQDAAIGGIVGATLAYGVVLLIGIRLAGLGSELLGGVSLAGTDWLLLLALPVLFVVMAIVAARRTVLSSLRKTL